jgi:fatty acid desaturase
MAAHGNKRSVIVFLQVALIVISCVCFLLQGLWSGYLWASLLCGALFVALRYVDHFFFEDR